jgi:drug/metabolite transporter (DMT)-like permease
LLIVFLSSAIWGVLWAPMRYAESFGISGLWVMTLLHALPAIVILPFIARAYIADRQHWLASFFAGGLMGIGFVLHGLGLVVASVTKTTVLFYLTPVWATLFAYVALSERVGLRCWLAGCWRVAGMFTGDAR